MEDSIKALDPEKRLAIIKDLSYISSITSAHTARLGRKLYKEATKNDFEPEIECNTDNDVVLYFFLRHEDITDKLAFLYPFYVSKSYLSYEAPQIEATEVDIKLTELHREFTRLANKDDNATEQDMEHLFLENVLYVTSTFQGSYDITSKQDTSTGEIIKKHVMRRIEAVRIAYIPEEHIVLVAGTISKQVKLLFMETFLRVVCNSSYDGKEERYDLSKLKNLSLDFTQFNKGTPFIKAFVKSVTLSYAQGKKKLRLTLPSSHEHANLVVLKEVLDELGMTDRFDSCDIVNMTFEFMFQNKEKPQKGVNVSCSLSKTKSSLCSLFEYERYTKSILQKAGIYQGFILSENK
jgi:hypothetical protein